MASAIRRFASKARPQPPFSSVHQGKKSGNGPASGDEKKLEELVRPVIPPPPRSQEERERLRAMMIRYGKLKRMHHIEKEIKVQEFMRAKWAAIDALPHRRKVEAMETPTTPFPLNRPIFTETPPIKGFNSGDIAKSAGQG